MRNYEIIASIIFNNRNLIISVSYALLNFSSTGSSVILYSDKKYRHYQYTVTTNWPGGIYG